MTAIAYNAKRNLVTTGFAVAGVDISATGTTNIFGSTTTDLSGLLLGEWIVVEGFLNDVNNGWHYVTVNSTTTTITTNSTLLTEAAGEPVLIVGYLHRYGLTYSFDTQSEKLDEVLQQVSNESKTLGGAYQSMLQRIETGWSFQSGWIQESEKPQWNEFLHSVMAREPFRFDAYGTVAAPDNPEMVTLDSKPTWKRIAKTNIWQVSFKVKSYENS